MLLAGDQLAPSQRTALASTRELLGQGPLVGLCVRDGCGRSTVLRLLADEIDAAVVTLGDIVETTSGLHPHRLEEGLLHGLLKPLSDHRAVVVDDLHVFARVFSSCHFSARPQILPLVLDTVWRALEFSGKSLVIGLDGPAPWPLVNHCLHTRMPPLTPVDFGTILANHFASAPLDPVRIHRFAPRLTGHHIRLVARRLAGQTLTTESFIEFLEKHALGSNVDTAAVQQVSLDSLHGVGDVIRSLEIDVTNPLEHPELAAELGLEAKKGVLLYGPPGTGKTTIGRALAHRLGSKFFLIDGTVISGTQNFYERIHRIFAAAKENAPSILFIDDSDLLFESNDETGLYRYLLTMLDGLESEAIGHVTVILTAMNIASLPPALIRSGRVELWLQMKLPDETARAAIMRDRLAQCPDPLRGVDVDQLAAATEELTGADLKRLVADALNLYGYDVARQTPSRAPMAYFEEALERLRELRVELQEAPPITAAHHGAASRSGYLAAMAALRHFDSSRLDEG
jgi:AAA+ superfamily predicted ATPase